MRRGKECEGSIGIRRRLRRAIETDCLARYQMQKAGGEYRLTIPFEDEADLAWQMDWLQGEIEEMAERVGGGIKADFRKESREQKW